MESLLRKLSEVLGEAQALVIEYKTKLSSLDQDKIRLDSDRKVLDLKLSDVSRRESLITPIENFRKAQTDLENDRLKLSTMKSAFLEEKQKFVQSSNAIRQQLNDKANETLEAQKNVDAQQKKIKDTIQSEIDKFISKFKNQ